MSIQYMVAAFKARVNSPITKLVLIKLADNSNDDGLCFPSYQHIADQCEVSRQSAINHVKILLELGVLQKENRMRNGENTSNQFVLSMSKMVELGSQRGGLGVVKEVDHPSQRGLLGSQRGGLGVVKEVDPESSLLTINEPSLNKHIVASDDARAVAHYLSKKILSENPKTKTQPEAWAKDIDKMIRLDNRTVNEIISVINWIYSPAGAFWIPNILSGKKLRDKFDIMKIQSARFTAPKKTPAPDNFEAVNYGTSGSL